VDTVRRLLSPVCRPGSWPSGNWTNLSLWFWTSSLMSCEKVNFYCLCHPIYGILSRPPNHTQTKPQFKFFKRVENRSMALFAILKY
jgi:hypothetical protein